MSTSTSIIRPGRTGHAQRTTWGYLTEDHPALDRVQNGISAVCGILAGAAVLATVFLTLGEVVARSVFSTPLGWSVSFIELYLLPAMAFFGLVAAYRSGAHVAVVSLFQKLRPRMQKVLLILAYVVLIVGLIAIGVPGFNAMLAAIENGEGPVPGASELPVPSAVWRAIIPLSALLGLILVVIDLYREVTAPADVVATDYDPGDGTEVDAESRRDLGHLADPKPGQSSADGTEGHA